jgi:hypothetical protein
MLMNKKKGRSRIRRIFRGIMWFLIAIIVSLNLFILLSGRFYLYKGIFYTYLSGETSPTIYDKDKFFSSTLPKSENRQPWAIHPKHNKMQIPAKYEQYLESLETRSFLVFRNDSLIFEKYWGDHKQSTVSNSFSAAKTVVSILIGIAADEGDIKSLDDPIAKYIPEFSGNGKERIVLWHRPVRPRESPAGRTQTR